MDLEFLSIFKCCYHHTDKKINFVLQFEVFGVTIKLWFSSSQ